MARRNANGEGSIYQRKDGRWEASVYVLTTSGLKKRVRIYATSRVEAHSKLTELKMRDAQGIPTAHKSWKLGDYLEYWLEEVIKPNRRGTTYDLYESNVRLFLKPSLGHIELKRLSVPVVQRFLTQQLANGRSVRKVQTLREVLSPALARAVREELITRNVARLVEVPGLQRSEIRPWSPSEVRQFLEAARSHQWYPAFLLVTLYGLRRGEVLGLRWCDVDLASHELHIRQQVFRAGGELQRGPLKTQAGRRDLPLLAAAADALRDHHARQTEPANEALIFSASSGRPVEPQNFTRAFQLICAKHGIRRIKLHHVRHTAATILKDLGIPARDTQLILGHSNISVTQQIYQHDTMDSRRDALKRMEAQFISQESVADKPEPVSHESWADEVDGSGSRQSSRQTATTPSLAATFKQMGDSQNKTDNRGTVAGFLKISSGDLTENRTPIARMKSRNRGDCERLWLRVTEVDDALAVWRRRWLLGAAAVNAAVNPKRD